MPRDTANRASPETKPEARGVSLRHGSPRVPDAADIAVRAGGIGGIAVPGRRGMTTPRNVGCGGSPPDGTADDATRHAEVAAARPEASAHA